MRAAGSLAPRYGPAIVLLEPSTEGRLAATLARHGEGWCATWLAAVDAPTGQAVR